MRNAERFLSQGKIRAAIGEYKKVVENDPKDFSTLNTLGDLYIKNSESGEAVGCYTKVAEHFSKQGFAQKAIAIYNKIQRIQPNSADVSAKLAKLYQLKGSFAEARSHYVALAEQYQRKGHKAEALEIWKQIAQLDPTNTEVYLKIADFCFQDDNKEEAAKAFTEAGLRLASQNHLEQAISAFQRALEIRQYDLTALNGLVSAQVKLGYADEAAKTLEGILEKQPYNREILYLLVDCYLDANNPSEAEKAVIRLVEQEPANYPKFLQLVETYVKNSDLDSAVRILSMSSEHLLVGGKPEEFLKWTNEILARNPEQVDALRLLVRYYGWQRDETELKKSLERLAEIARLKESADDEHYALSQLILISPHEVAYAKRLQEIKYEGGEIAESATDFSFQPQPAEESPMFDGFALVEGVTANGEAELLEDYSQYTSEIADSEAEAFVYADSAANGNGGFSDGNDNFAIVGETFAAPSANSNPVPDELKPADEMRLAQEIESVQFYVTQGYLDLAGKTLDVLEAEFGMRSEFASLRAQMRGETTAQEFVEEAGSGHDFGTEIFSPAETIKVQTFTQTVEEPKQKDAAPLQNFDFLDDFRSELGLEESAPEAEGDYETHYHLAIAYKEMGLMEESIREFQDAINMCRADDGTRHFFQCCNLLGHCFVEQGMPNLALMWYRRALETPNLHDEERQAMLYEMANAYEMGGEAPKAVECFEQIYAVNVDYRDVSSRLEQLREHNFAM
ncbi:MAG TPA: tetratricopeptide repeat protein [Pyrinomonadaceae bacterium]|jgi:tetratricopeptide (TPR) repeat protein